VWCVAALLGAAAALTADVCEPDCSSAAVGTNVADPKNCHKFYVCFGEDQPPISLSCPDGQYFKDTATGCTEETDPCENSCKPTGCHSTCDPDLFSDTIVDLMNCSIYYLCSSGNVVGSPGVCPAEKPYYDGTECVETDEKCCSDQCYPYCQDTTSNITDPTDCNNYYSCTVVGPADQTQHFTCPQGSNFDVTVGKCVPGATCNTLCAGSTIPGEGTTTPSSGCVDSMTCSSVGYFAKCSYCQQQYFHCVQAGEEAVVQSCTGTLVFNPGPDYPYCVSPSDCPHKSLF
ncbi:hypothetical protein OTU49_016256, partial [Cherax quadricarinatus]